MLPIEEQKPLLYSPGCGMCLMFDLDCELWLVCDSASRMNAKPLLIPLNPCTSLCNVSGRSHCAQVSVYLLCCVCRFTLFCYQWKYLNFFSATFTL